MSSMNRETYQVWSFRFCLITALTVVLLSWLNGVVFNDLLIRGGVSFGVLYLILLGALRIFDETGSTAPEHQESELSSKGVVLDIAVGDDESTISQGQQAHHPGQVDKELSAGLPDSERQAEIVRQMGWEDQSN